MSVDIFGNKCEQYIKLPCGIIEVKRLESYERGDILIWTSFTDDAAHAIYKLCI